MKKFLFTLAMLLVSIGAFAQTTFTVDDITYKVLNSSNVEVSSNSTWDRDITIPAQVTDPTSNTTYTVTRIGNTALGVYYTSSTTKTIGTLVLPSTITSIGSRAFQGTKFNGNLDLSNVTEIGESAFNSAGAVDNSNIITLSTSNLTTIGYQAFYYFKGTLNNLSSGLTSLGSRAFTRCTLNAGTVTIPGLTSIDYQTFMGCKLNGDITLPNVTSVDDNGLGADTASAVTLTLPSVQTIGKTAFYLRTIGYFENSDKPSRVVINLTGAPITSVGDGAFYRCKNITGTVNLKNATTIGKRAFESKSNIPLNYTIYLPEVTCTIGSQAFEYNTATIIGDANNQSLSGCTSLGTYVFQGCINLQGKINLSNLTSIPYKAFQNCNNAGFTNVTFSDKLDSVGDYAFQGVTAAMTLPEKLIEFYGSWGTPEGYSFDGCTHLTGKAQVKNTQVPPYLFRNSGISVVTFPNATGFSGAQQLAGTHLKYLVIPTTVTNFYSNIILDATIGTLYVLSPSQSISGSTYLSSIITGASAQVSRRIEPSDVTSLGSGANVIVKVNTIKNQDGTTNASAVIPNDELPENYITRGVAGDDNSWKARKIVLTDSRTVNNTFSCDVDFTADSVVYNRNFDDDRSSTMCLPFAITSAMRNVTGHKFKMYDFAGYNATTGNATFNTLADNPSDANTPYIIAYNSSKGTFQMPTFTNVSFGATTNMNNKSYNGLNFAGTYSQKAMDNDGGYTYYGIYYGYFVQSNGSASVMPFRSYFYTYNAPSTNNAPSGIELSEDGGQVGIELVDEESSSIVFSNDVYDLNGRLVRKNAESLNGLPKGIYIWRGKKMMNWK